MFLQLTRIQMFPNATLGILTGDNFEFWTLEPTWLDNDPNVSCIPTGSYICERYLSSRFQNAYRVLNVPNRTDIEIHPGNFPSDTHGCILLGKGIRETQGVPIMLTNSRDALSEFVLAAKWEFKLTISEAFQ